MFTPDKPIESAKEDLLGRSAFASAFGDAIISYEHKDSLAIGLLGPWGSGKTSIINLAIERIKNASEHDDKTQAPIIVRFNPWNFSNQNQLIEQFFIQLSANLTKPGNTQRIIDIGEQIAKYAQLAAP